MLSLKLSPSFIKDRKLKKMTSNLIQILVYVSSFQLCWFMKPFEMGIVSKLALWSWHVYGAWNVTLSYRWVSDEQKDPALLRRFVTLGMRVWRQTDQVLVLGARETLLFMLDILRKLHPSL